MNIQNIQINLKIETTAHVTPDMLERAVLEALRGFDAFPLCVTPDGQEAFVVEADIADRSLT